MMMKRWRRLRDSIWITRFGLEWVIVSWALCRWDVVIDRWSGSIRAWRLTGGFPSHGVPLDVRSVAYTFKTARGPQQTEGSRGPPPLNRSSIG